MGELSAFTKNIDINAKDSFLKKLIGRAATDLKYRGEDLSAKMSKRIDRVSSLEKQLESQTQKIIELEGAMTSLQLTSLDLEGEVTSVTMQNTLLQIQLSELGKALEEERALQHETSQKLEKMTELKEKSEERDLARKDLVNVQARIIKIKSESDELQKDIVKLKSDVKEGEKERNAGINERVTLVKELNRWKSAFEGLLGWLTISLRKWEEKGLNYRHKIQGSDGSEGCKNGARSTYKPSPPSSETQGEFRSKNNGG